MMLADDQIKKAAMLLKQGQLVAIPTETVYGLAGNATSDKAVALIYETKGRPQFNPLITHVLSLEDAKAFVTVNKQAEALAKQFWPGPLTLVLPRKEGCALSLLVSAGLDSVAIRSPAHPVARALLAETGFPLAAPSANRSGKISPTEARHVGDEFGSDIAILDGGKCSEGIESTVIDLTGAPTVLRPGTITQEAIEAVIGKIATTHNGSIKSPGMLEKHYAPNTPLRLNAMHADSGELLLAFGAALTGSAENLSPSGDLKEAAANLFHMLRALDKKDAKGIAVMPIPEEGLGIAINDRLRRAAKG
jgi:L-threonylcarbamoyladenylate synthase